MKSLTLLWRQLLSESSNWCRICTDRDFKTATDRFESEGLSFFTITLSNFGKDFEKSLDQGFVGSDQFAGFKRTGGLPRFLGGFLRLVFEPDGRALLRSPSIDAIHAVRQLTLVFGKLQIPCSETRNRKAVDGYVQVEHDLRNRDSAGGPPEEELRSLRRIFAMLYGGVLAGCGGRLDAPHRPGDRRSERLATVASRDLDSLMPRHGSGATADRYMGNRKYDSLRTGWTRRLDAVFPAGDYVIPSLRYCSLLASQVVEPRDEVPVKVTLVPKTLKTPRIIAEEPTAVMYMQQALWRSLRDEWYKDDLLPHFVDYAVQDHNRDLARRGSFDGSLATLDLSEASDRVSNSLVRYLFAPHQPMADLVDATRSRKASVPYGHGVIRLAKYASMGSALCFPVESMVFFAIIILSWEQRRARPVRRADLRRLIGLVRVYGDDMIVPVDMVHSVVSNLELFGFKVNAGKSFWTGKFRESCGGDYYDGSDVSVVRLRRLLPTHRKDAEEVIAMVSFRNQLYQAGYWETCRWLDERVRKILPHFPLVHPTSPVVGRHSVLPYRAERTDRMHRPLVRGFVVRAPIPENPLDGEMALLKFFVERGEEPLDAGHLERSGRPRTVDIKARWTTPY